MPIPSRMISAVLASLPLLLPAAVLAQDQEPERIPFAGGELTITETPDYEKILAFDGRELARDYFVFFDRIAEVGGTEVALFYVGPGGNACAPSVALVWKPDDGELAADLTEEDCATPAPSISDAEVLFVPYLLPGEEADVTSWAPDQGFSLRGRIAYVPQPDTTWGTFDAATIDHPMDLFRNADIHAAAAALLGDDLSDVALGLGTSGQPDIAPDGVLAARGCVPHACGVSDTFVAVDPAGQAIYFAQQDDRTRFWPDRANWPAAISTHLPNDF